MKFPPLENQIGESCDLSATLAAFIRHAVELKRTESDEEPPLGTSKIGGNPHLPAGFVWPYYEGANWEDIRENRPLSFIAQIDLAAAAPYDPNGCLPTSGYLYFFYDVVSQCWGFDPEDAGCARVYYLDVPADALTETPLPADLDEEARVPLSAIAFRTMDELPGYEEFDDLVDTDRFGDDFDWDRYDEAVEETIGRMDCSPDEVCKLLGYADLVQGSMLEEVAMVTSGRYCGGVEGYRDRTEVQKAADRAAAREWVLLAQFGTLSDEVMFGDCGCIYFYIRKEDLSARRFDRVWLCLQCG